jgi:IS5 family transposase
MKQLTVAAVGFERYAKTTRRAAFLAEMERAVPWPALCRLIEPVYPQPGNGRPPVGVERMLGIYFLQHWFNLSDPAVEEALYDSLAMRRFVGIDLGREPVPDETTVCRFRHLLEAHDLGRRLFDEVQRHLTAKELKIATGTIVDARSSMRCPRPRTPTRRDPEMHQTKKGNQWYFGMKAHFGVDSRTKLIHAAVATPANVADSTVLPRLLHGNETRVWGDQAYRGQRAVIRRHAPRAQDFVNRRYRHRGVVDGVARAKNRTTSKVRGQGRAADRDHQAGVWLCQGALSRAHKERASLGCDLRACQAVHGAPASAALSTGVVCPQPSRQTVQTPQCDAKAAPIPRTVASEHIAMPPHSSYTPYSDLP